MLVFIFRLSFDNITRKTANALGVKIRVPGFGDTDSIEYLTTNRLGSCKNSPLFQLVSIKSNLQSGLIEHYHKI